jgi:FkbM family methyltransferase
MKIFFQVIPTLAVIFSGGSVIHFCKLLSQLYIFFLYTRLFKKKKTTTIVIFYKKCRASFILKEYLDFAVLIEVFVDSEYDYGLSASTCTILDLGAHIGDTAIFYSGECPEAKIYALEPAPESYSRLLANTQTLPNVKVLQKAIGLESKTVQLNMNEASLGNSLYSRKSDCSSVDVEQISMKELMRQESIAKFSLIKFDIEGAEFDLFKDPDFFTYADTFIGELHFDLVPSESVDALKARLGDEVSIEGLRKHGRYLLKFSHK